MKYEYLCTHADFNGIPLERKYEDGIYKCTCCGLPAVEIKPLKKFNEKELSKLSELDNHELELEFLENEGYFFGAFYSNELIAYCSLGYHDIKDNDVVIDGEGYTLCDVFVHPDWRHKTIGSQLITRAIEMKNRIDGRLDYITGVILMDTLFTFYEQLGFAKLDHGVIIKKFNDY